MGTPFDIVLELDKYTKNSYLTHNFHPYPAKFIPQIPAEIIRVLTEEGQKVLDPFCGSGTTLVECKLLGRDALGLDVNPLACLIAKVKTTTLSISEAKEVSNITNKINAEILNGKTYPKPDFLNINLWFKDFVQNELSVIRSNLQDIEDSRIKNFLMVAFSSIIVKASNQESDTRYKSVDKKIKPGDVASFFQSRVADMLSRIDEFKKVAKKSSVKVIHTDATLFSDHKNQFDLAVTSPPYLNSYDYYLYHKHRMMWLGMDYRFAQENEFGSRNKHNDKGLGLDSYNDAIRKNANTTFNSLRPGGYYCLVVGDGILRGELIKMNRNFDDIFCNLGYEKIHEIAFEQRKYTRSFTRNVKNEYKESYVLIYQKPIELRNAPDNFHTHRLLA